MEEDNRDSIDDNTNKYAMNWCIYDSNALVNWDDVTFNLKKGDVLTVEFKGKCNVLVSKELIKWTMLKTRRKTKDLV